MELKIANTLLAALIIISCTMLVWTINYVCSELGGSATSVISSLYV